ncbi:hypothetical protein N9Z58_01470 [bacterium]|nr:hypothetical protein [bacterium]
MDDSNNFKKPLLFALVISVAVGAVLGIGVVLLNNWGWYEVRVILTTLIIVIASLCGLACDLSKLPFGNNLLPRIGLCLTGITATLFLLGLWGVIESRIYWKSATCCLIVGFATVHICLLSIAKLVGRYRWVYTIGCQVILGLACILCVILIFEIESEEIFRPVAAISIVAAAITLLIPILHRLGKMNSKKQGLLMPVDARNVAVIDEQISQLEKRITTLRHLKSKIVEEDAEEQR